MVQFLGISQRQRWGKLWQQSMNQVKRIGHLLDPIAAKNRAKEMSKRELKKFT